MAKKGRKKIKDLVEILENPDHTGYIGGDYEDILELQDDDKEASDYDENQEWSDE